MQRCPAGRWPVSRRVALHPVYRSRIGSGPWERGKGPSVEIRGGYPRDSRTCRTVRVLPENGDGPLWRSAHGLSLRRTGQAGRGVAAVDSTPGDCREPDGTYGVLRGGVPRGGGSAGQKTVGCIRPRARSGPALAPDGEDHVFRSVLSGRRPTAAPTSKPREPSSPAGRTDGSCPPGGMSFPVGRRGQRDAALRSVGPTAENGV